MNAEQKARELLAEEYERDRHFAIAQDIRDDRLISGDRLALRAITRALQQRPSEDEVEAAAKRMWQLVGFERGYPDWQAADESEKEPFRRMARAALGVER